MYHKIADIHKSILCSLCIWVIICSANVSLIMVNIEPNGNGKREKTNKNLRLSKIKDKIAAFY